MNRRWYDHDPTISMAVSLLQNASHGHQETTARFMMMYMEREGILAEYELSPEKISFLFPLLKRMNLDTSAWEMLEVMKRLPHGRQIEMSLTVINYIYMLETGYHDELYEDRSGVKANAVT